MRKFNAGKFSDLKPGTCKGVEAFGYYVAVFNVKGKLFAVDGTCLHMGGSLGEGKLEGTTVTCPMHGWKYDVSSGQCKGEPFFKLEQYSVKAENGEIILEFP
jgi:nitrite reductase/ring-hydroxylating ferredoxin subunit